MKTSQNDLEQRRREAAELAFHTHDYGDHDIVDWSGWTYLPQSDAMEITAFARPSGMPSSADAERWLFRIVFERDSATVSGISDGSHTSDFLSQQQEPQKHQRMRA